MVGLSENAIRQLCRIACADPAWQRDGPSLRVEVRLYCFRKRTLIIVRRQGYILKIGWRAGLFDGDFLLQLIWRP
jgi:hypothetical protein